MAGKRDYYIDNSQPLLNQLNTNDDIKILQKLKHSIYECLVGLELQANNFIPDNEDDNGQEFAGFILWHQDKMIELPSFRSVNQPLDFQICLYKVLLAQLTKMCYTLDKTTQLKLKL